MKSRTLVLLVGSSDRSDLRRRRCRCRHRAAHGGDDGESRLWSAGDQDQPLRPGRPALEQGRLQGAARAGRSTSSTSAADEGPHTFTVVKKADAPRHRAQAVNCTICNKLGEAHGADPNSDAPPKFPFLENGVGQDDAAERRPARRLRHHRQGQEGRLDRPQGHRQEGHDALLHVPHPPVDAGEGRRQAEQPPRASRTPARGPWPCGRRSSGARLAAPGRRAGRATTGSPPCRRRGTSCPTGATRSWTCRSTRRTRLPDGRLPPLHARTGAEPLPNAPRASADGLRSPAR